MRRWLQSLFTPANLAPILVRGRLDHGELPHRVEVQVTWLPSLVTRTYSGSGAQGMCLIPWYGESSRALVAVSAEGAKGEVTVRAGQTRFGRAFDVHLEAGPGAELAEGRVFTA